MKQTDAERLQIILRTWNSLSGHIASQGITPEMLLEDEYTQWAITTPLYNIGEKVYQLSPEFKRQYPDIPWSVVSGLRHRLVHNYEGVNWTIIVEIVFREMKDFAEKVEQISKDPIG